MPMMLNKLDAELNFHQTALRVRGQRQELIAANIANADTPNFKAVSYTHLDVYKRQLLGQSIEGGHIGSLVQPAAFLIVMCGTFGAVILQTRPKNFIEGVKMLSQVFNMPVDDRQDLAKRINLWSTYARKEGLFMLESYMQKETEPFIKKGMQLMICLLYTSRCV